MDIQKLFHLYQGIGVSLAVLLFCVIAVIGGVFPSVNKLKESFVSIQALSMDNSMLEKKLSILESYDEATLKEKLAIALSAVPGDKGMPGLFGTVETVAGTAGVTILSMNVTGGSVASSSAASKQSALEKQLGSRVLPFSVTVIGTFPSLQKFITLLPSVRRLMRIRSFSISFPKNDKPLSVTLSMDAFYEPYMTALGGTGSVVTALSDAELAVLDTLSQFPLVAQVEDASLSVSATLENKPNPFAR